MKIKQSIASGLAGIVIALTPSTSSAYDMTLDSEKRLVKIEDYNRFKTEIEYLDESDVPNKIITFDLEKDYDEIISFGAGGTYILEVSRFSDGSLDRVSYVCNDKNCTQGKKKVALKDVKARYDKVFMGLCFAIPARMEKQYKNTCNEYPR